MEGQHYVEMSNFPAHNIPNGKDEILILPNPYFQRLIRQISTLNPFKTNGNGSTGDLVFKEIEFFQLPQKGPLIIYSLPGLGSTSLLINYIRQIQTNKRLYCPKLLMFVDMKKASAVINRNPSALWTLPTFLAAYLEISGTSVEKEMLNILTNCNTNGQTHLHYEGEVFFDGLDKAAMTTLEPILKMLAKVEWNTSSIRVWVTARTHMKQVVNHTLNPSLTYELLPLSMDNQIGYFMSSWDKKKSPTAKKSVQIFLNEMEKKVPGYHKTIGGCPSHCSIIRNVFHDLGETIMKIDEKQIISEIAKISIAKLFEELVTRKLDYYVRSFTWEPKTESEKKEFAFCDMEYKRLERTHVRHAIATYPTFAKESKTLYYDSQYTELYNIGILFENNGTTQFFHPMYAHYIIGQFLVNSGRSKSTGIHHINFFLNTILFDDESKGIRKMFDSYWALQQKRRVLRESVQWSRVRCFLIDHYYLENVLENPAAPGQHEQIKNNGNILHLAILEQNFKLFQVLIDSLKGSYSDQLTKLLSMRVSLDVFDSNSSLFCTQEGAEGTKHLVTTLDLLALFCRDEEHAPIINRVCRCLGFYSGDRPTLKDNYFAKGTWTVLHYAAMNSNYTFVKAMFHLRNIPCDVPNPDGLLPIHMVLHEQWYFAMKIVDHPHPQLKGFYKMKYMQTRKNNRDSRDIWCFEGMVKHLKDYEDVAYNVKEDYLRPHLLTLEYLLANGANVNAKDTTDEKTILHQAVEINSVSLILLQYLLNLKANPNLKDCLLKTPLYYAQLHHGRKQVWTMLLDNGAIFEISDDNEDYGYDYDNDYSQFMDVFSPPQSPI